ncbi:MAG: uroporphyrinogen decarboxylase family protein, partial [bacterium]
MRLINLVRQSQRRLVVPLMGYPGTQLTNTTLKQNEFNWGIQFWSLSELADLLQPDAIFFMMDLSVEAGALGFPIRYPLEESPSVEQHLVKEVADLDQFMSTDILKDGRATVFLKTMELMAENLDILKGAYCIGPFTLAGLLTGASEIALATIDRPEFLHEVLNFCTQVITKYVVALVDSGADIIAILEPTAVFLSPQQFEEFSGNYIKKINRAIHAIPVLHICGDTSHLIEKMCETGAEAEVVPVWLWNKATGAILRKDYSYVHIVNCIEAIDLERTEAEVKTSKQGRVYLGSIRRLVLRRDFLEQGIRLFRLAEVPTLVLVDQEFKKSYE